MAALCEDTGQGRISSKVVQIQANHAAWKAANREKRARMKMLMEAKKYGRKDDEVEAGARQVNEPAAVPSAAPDAEVVEGAEEGEGETVEPAAQDATGSGFDYSQAMATSRFNVQVRIGPNGETIIDEESLFVDREEEVDTTEYTHVEESDTTKFVNSATYGKKFRGTRWSAEETELFFDALSQFGENYELISFVLPGRDRKACKNKFKAEDKKNPARIDHCLKNRVPYDIQTLERLTGKDFSGPTPEIRAPTPLTMRESTAGASDKEYDHSDVVRKQSGTPGLEVLGYAEDFGDDSDKDKDG
ncbi:hypothetical protein PLICRDRAFT_101319 [Plicaturopsis crispa FD-325 SS-3]|nr:hypothetical protein PLICRDRAFT_101319 [Plicaturopsis crispa FD-325 SS-3]